MSFISKILDAFKLESTREMERAEKNSTSKNKEGHPSNAYNKYYENIAKQKENNLQITYEDVNRNRLLDLEYKRSSSYISFEINSLHRNHERM